MKLPKFMDELQPQKETPLAGFTTSCVAVCLGTFGFKILYSMFADGP